MNEKTQNEYLSLANHFIKSRFPDGNRINHETISEALLNASKEYSPSYWRKLRNALVFQQKEAGFDRAVRAIRGLKNPLTAKGGDKSLIPKKKKRCKKIIEEDEKKIINELTKRGDFDSIVAIRFAKYLGVRVEEMQHIEFIEPGKIFINGAKKSHNGLRGLDRTLFIEDKKLCEYLRKNANRLRNKKMKNIQDRLADVVKQLFPQRAARPTLYSWRHQMGSNLKASGLDPIEMAYIMGHQSTRSISVYGNKRTANGGIFVSANASDPAFQKIREKHIETDEISNRVKASKSKQQKNKKPQLSNNKRDFKGFTMN